MIKLCFLCIITIVSSVYKGFYYSSKPICVGLKVGMADVYWSRKLNKGNLRFSIADSRGMPQFVQVWVISLALTSVESNCFTSLVRALTTISRVTLPTFRVLARDTHLSVNFELSCTVGKYKLCSCSTSLQLASNNIFQKVVISQAKTPWA